MNVELPDGTVVEDVPDGITRADLATKLKANGMNVPDEWLTKRKVGGVESALRTAGEAARKAVGMFDMAAAGLAGMFSDSEAERVLAMREERQQGMRDAYAQKPDEEFSGPGELIGGVLSMPIEMAGGMGAQHGFERATDVIDRGGSMEQAEAAGKTTGAVRVALNALPLKAGGAVGKAIESRLGALAGGAVTGGAIAGVGGMAGRAAENVTLPEGKQFEDLKQDTGPDLVEIGMGAAFGALPGAAAAYGKRKKERAAAKAQADAAVFPVDKMTDLGDGEFRAPNGATITQEAWEGASQRVRDGWLKASEKVPVGEAKELDIKPEDIERQAEIDRIKQEHPAGPVAEALREIEARRAKAAEKEAAAAKTRADAAELRRAAGLVKDPEVQAELRARADKLDPPGKIPTGKVTEGQPDLPDETPKKPLPVGEATELPVERIDAYEPIPVGEAREITPERAADAPEGQIPVGEAAEVLPVGEATEVPHIPVGEAAEMIPTGEATEVVPAKKIPVGKATETTPDPAVLRRREEAYRRAAEEALAQGDKARYFDLSKKADDLFTQGEKARSAQKPAATEIPAKKIPVGKATEIIPERIELGGAQESVAARVEGSTRPVTPDEAVALVQGKTEKPGGVDPARMIDAGIGNGREYRLGDVPLDLFQENEAGALYDSTVNLERAEDYSRRSPEGAPPVIATQGRDGKLRIADGGHRISAARIRGDRTIRALVALRKPSRKPDDQQLRPDDLQPEARTEGAQAAGREEAASQDATRAEADETLDLDLPRIDETFMRAQERAQQAKTPPPDERGVAAVRRALQEGRDNGALDKDGADLALWALGRNPHLAHGLQVDVKDRPEGGIAKGSYNSAARIVTLFKKHDNPQTAAHEILHHSEHMMPPTVQEGIRRAWQRAVDDAVRAGGPKVAAALDDVRQAMRKDREAAKRALAAFENGTLDKQKFYHLVDPSEFWAVNGARILHERFTGRGSWRAKARQWLREMVQHVKHAIGLRSDAPILKALDDILDPKKTVGAQLSGKMIKASSAESLAISGPTRAKLTEETPAEARERHVVDSLKPVERAQAAVAPKDEAADMRLAMKLAPGRIGDRAKKLEKDFVEPIGKAMKQAKKAGLTVKDVDDYLTALHAPERNAVIAQRNAKMPDGGSGLTNQQAKDIIDGFTPEQRKHLDGISKLVRSMNSAKLDAMVADGVITQDMRTKLDAQFKHYVPLKTLDKEDAFTGVGRGFEMRPTDIQYTLGRTSRASSPLAASMLDATRAISRGERARVDKSIWEYAQNEDARGLIREYHPNMPPKEVMKNEMGSDGKVKQVVDSEKLREHTVSLVIDGEQKRLFVPNAEFAKALKTAGDPEQVGRVLRAVGTLTRAFSRTLTEWNPAFAPVNVVKDGITAAIRAKRLGVDAGAVAAGILQAMKDIVQFKRGKAGKGADAYRKMKEIGGAQGAYGLTKFGDMLADLEKRGAELGYDEHKGGIGRQFSKTLSTVGAALGHYNEVFEYATRLSAYRNAIAKGMTPKQAAAVARDITLDFNVSGALGRQMGHAYSFFNAAIQGISADVRDLRDPRTKLRMLSLLGIGAAVQVANDMLGGENEETGEKNIDAQHEGVQDSNIVLQPVGVKVPLPPGIAAGLYAIGRRLMKLVLRGGENAENEIAGIASAMLKSALPVRFGESEAGTVSNALQAVVPSIPAPFYHLETNRDGLGHPILPETFNKTDRPYYTTSRSTTSGAAKAVSQGLNTLTGGDDVTPGASQRYLGKYASPEAIDYLVGYFTGGAGQLALQASNIAKNAATGKPQAVDKIPVLKRFVVTEPKSYTSRRYKELGEDFERANTYRKKGQDDRIEPRVSQALDEYLAAEKQIDRIVKELRTADENRKEEIWAEVKAMQSRVIKAYNRGANQ